MTSIDVRPDVLGALAALAAAQARALGRAVTYSDVIAGLLGAPAA